MTQQEKRRLKMVLLAVAFCTAVICAIVVMFFRASAFAKIWKVALDILTPFIYGIAIAYILRPIALFFEKNLLKLEKRVLKKEHKGLCRIIGILLSLVLLFVLLIMLFMTIIPEIISSISGLIAQLPGAVKRFQAWIGTLDNGGMSHEVIMYIEQAVDTVAERLQNFLQTDLLPNMSNLISGVTSSFASILAVLGDFGLGCIISAYLMGGWEKFIAQSKLIVYGIFPKKGADWIKKEAHIADHLFSGFIHGKLLDSLIVGIICFIFCAIAKMPYAILVSVIVGVTNMIPFFGPYMGAIPSFVLILTASPFMSIVFLIFVICLQQFDGNFLGPKILGDRLGLSGFWILFAIMVFGSLWGIVGMLLGAPVFAMIYGIVRSFVQMLLHKRGEYELFESYEETYHAKDEKKAEKRSKSKGSKRKKAQEKESGEGDPQKR